MKLYEITDELLALYQIPVDGDEEGENWQAFNELLATLQDQLNYKAENIFKLLKNWKVESEMFIAQAQAIEQEADANRRKAKTLDSKAEKLKDYVINEMKKLQLDKLSTPLFTCSVRAGLPAAEVTDVVGLPDKFVDRVPNIMEIKKALLYGETVEGARIIEGKPFIVLR